MNNSKLISVLRTFDKREFKQFGKFVASPFFSSGRNIIPLFDALKKFYPNFNDEEFSRDYILKELSRKGYKANNQQLKTQMSEMYKLVEQFLISQRGDAYIGLDIFSLSKNLSSRGLFKITEAKILNSIRSAEKKPIDRDALLNNYYLVAAASIFYDVCGKFPKAIPMYNYASEIFVHQFLCTVSRYVFSIVVLKKGFNFDIRNNLLFGFLNITHLDKLLKVLEHKNDAYSVASRIHVLLILMYLKIQNKGVDYYLRLKEELFKNISVFSSFSQGFLVHAIYCWTDEMLKGQHYIEFANETFEIINFRLKNNLYRATTHLHADAFCSFFYIGFILKKEDWLKNFKKKYLSEVTLEQRNNCNAWSNVFMDFLEKDYTKCLKDINNLKSFILPFTYPVKRLQLMVFYELGYFNEAFYAIDAFKSFLRQNKNVTGDFLESNMCFIKYYTRLLKHKSREEEFNMKKMLIDIKNSVTDNQEWLIEKIDEAK